MKQYRPCTVKLNSFTVEVTRKRMKSIRLRVRPDGQVRLSVPLSLTDAEITQFLAQRQDWIEAQRQHFAAASREQLQLADSSTLQVLGVPCRLRVETAPRFSLTLSDGEALLRCPAGSSDAQRTHYVNEWYRALLKQEIACRLPFWEERTGLFCAGWQIRDMRSRWGSCTPKTEKLRFSLQLAQMPPECLDYVILHELCHLAVPNHGADFKALLDRHMPDWQQRKKLLNQR